MSDYLIEEEHFIKNMEGLKMIIEKDYLHRFVLTEGGDIARIKDVIFCGSTFENSVFLVHVLGKDLFITSGKRLEKTNDNWRDER